MKKILSITLSMVLMIALAGCGATQTEGQKDTETEPTEQVTTVDETVENKTQYPITIVTYDANGEIVEQVIEKAPERIITNNLSMTQILIDLGLSDKIVGMLNPDNEIADEYKDAIAAIPHIGDKKTVSKEVIMSYEPDIIMGRCAMFNDKSLGTIASWNEIEIDVFTQKASITAGEQDLYNVIEDVRVIGEIFDVQEAAETYISDLTARLENVVATETDGDYKNALIMCAYNDETFGAYKSALQESALNELGYTNVATGTSGLTLENLVTMNPELIIYVTSDRNKALDENAVELMYANEVISGVPAVANQNIMTISYDEFMDYGPAIIGALEKISAFINE